jgi:hypothetical protein
MESDKRHLYTIRYKMKKQDLDAFLGGLHEMQMDMIETVVTSKERQGFPEVTVLIKHIMEKK